MFIALLIIPLVCLFHIINHALFKSLLFLLAGCLIHVQLKFQSIYKIKLILNKFVIQYSLIKIIFLLGGSVLILSFSKEGIIHCCIHIVSSGYLKLFVLICGFLTFIYTLKIYMMTFQSSMLGIANQRLCIFRDTSCFTVTSLSFFTFFMSHLIEAFAFAERSVITIESLLSEMNEKHLSINSLALREPKEPKEGPRRGHCRMELNPAD
jgi:NADH:ubiquinone oxidoreductase subunit 5 (subunit L)/multisubunit Na+/H+ antiporter MnhA subunit